MENKYYAGREDIKSMVDILGALPYYLIEEGHAFYKNSSEYFIIADVYNNFKQGTYDRIIFNTPKEDLPLYINSEDATTRALVRWRMKYNF